LQNFTPASGNLTQFLTYEAHRALLTGVGANREFDLVRNGSRWVLVEWSKLGNDRNSCLNTASRGADLATLGAGTTPETITLTGG